MKKASYVFGGFGALCLVLYLALSPALAKEKTYIMKGKISAVDKAYNTVVIKVPLDGKTFTVGGPLSSDAVMKKAGRLAKLSDFSVGDKVTVKWRATDRGHIIEALNEK